MTAKATPDNSLDITMLDPEGKVITSNHKMKAVRKGETNAALQFEPADILPSAIAKSGILDASGNPVSISTIYGTATYDAATGKYKLEAPSTNYRYANGQPISGTGLKKVWNMRGVKTTSTMAITIGAYALLFGWQVALGLVALLFVHEMGHAIAMKREGIDASPPIFIPFLGAVINMREMPKTAYSEAKIGLAGPVIGSIGALVPVALWFATGNDIWQQLAFIGLFLNLFNLLPVVPLDGGRAMAALSPWVWIVGFAMLFPVAYFLHSFVVILVIIFGGIEMVMRLKSRKKDTANGFYKTSAKERLIISATYAGLLVFLVGGLVLVGM